VVVNKRVDLRHRHTFAQKKADSIECLGFRKRRVSAKDCSTLGSLARARAEFDDYTQNRKRNDMAFDIVGE
jgi:hypothetical protein